MKPLFVFYNLATQNTAYKMNKRYQVFVSSTFTDLQEERSKVIQTIMELDCIPAGMELFPAIDDEQFNFIKKVINDCDYYLLIIGGRYGSISDDGLSYTEKEYDYAIDKGLKVIALIHENPKAISVEKSDITDASREKLSIFREKALTGRIVKFWNNADQLPGIVALSLSKTIKTYPAIGWIRANELSNYTSGEDLIKLVNENEKLKKVINEMSTKQTILLSSLAQGEDIYKLNYYFKFDSYYKDCIPIGSEHFVEITWEEIFNIIGSKMMKDSLFRISTDDPIANAIRYSEKDKLTINYKIEISKYHDFLLKVYDDTYLTILLQFQTLGYVDKKSSNWYLTDLGIKYLQEIKCIKR